MKESRCGFICPDCRSSVEERDRAFGCTRCGREYAILFGIPDFRLQGDRYLSLEEERAKAARLHEFARAHDFKQLLSFYYSITDDVPAHLEKAFIDYVLTGPARAMPALSALAPDGGRWLLDLGCGSGGALLAASAMFEQRTGVDIALRWLVIAQKRFEECGVKTALVCADAEALPFAAESFSHVLASDLLEHTRSPAASIRSAGSVLAQEGRLYVSSSNGRWIGPHPATGVWAAGLMPPALRASYLKRRHGVDILRAVSFVSAGSLRRMARAAGLREVGAGPLRPEMKQLAGRSRLFRLLARSYSMLATMPLLRTVLLHAGPVFQIIFVKERST